MKILNILVRRYLPLENFEQTIEFYENVIGQKARLKFNYPEYNLKISQVASMLFIGGTEESLQPFKATQATFLVDGIDQYAQHLPTKGATILSQPKDVPTGRNMRVQHPDGMIVEYVEHKIKHPSDNMLF